jgi:hypothetical protein
MHVLDSIWVKVHYNALFAVEVVMREIGRNRGIGGRDTEEETRALNAEKQRTQRKSSGRQR